MKKLVKITVLNALEKLEKPVALLLAGKIVEFFLSFSIDNAIVSLWLKTITAGIFREIGGNFLEKSSGNTG